MLKSLLALILCAGALGGCGLSSPTFANTEEYVNPQRLSKGLVVILPGIEGVSHYNRHIREGLERIDYAVMIRPWGVPVPGVGMVVNQTNFLGNRMAGAGVARSIYEYQQAHPGCPVYIIGHSGGGGVAVFAAESLADMPGAQPVEGLVLIAASISKDYDLTKALTMTRRGILNVHNPDDTSLLGTGTTAMGCVDGVHSESAGLNGFTRPFAKLQEIVASGDDDPHGAGTRSKYVRARIRPWLLSGPPTITVAAPSAKPAARK